MIQYDMLLLKLCRKLQKLGKKTPKYKEIDARREKTELECFRRTLSRAGFKPGSPALQLTTQP